MQKLPFNFSNSVLVNVTKFIDTFKLHNKTLWNYKNTTKFNYLKPEKHLTELLELNDQFAGADEPVFSNPETDTDNPKPLIENDDGMNELLQ
jgi:hypothetical protein